MRPVSIAAGETFSVCRMGRSDVVARMLIELLDGDCMKAVVEALAGLRTEEAVQAVVQVSLTLASADRPDVIADASVPLCLCFYSSSCVQTSLSSPSTGKKGIANCIALAPGRKKNASIWQCLRCLLPKESAVPGIPDARL